MVKTIMMLPKPLQEGDEITLAGNFMDDAKQVSINFASVAEGDPDDIIYQFKVDSNSICQNWKRNGEWMLDETTNSCSSTLMAVGTKLVLTFNFCNDEVSAYSGDEPRSFECQFRLNEPMSNISAVIISGDISRIQEVTFRYA